MTAEECFNRYFSVRMKFFQENPQYQKIFIEVVLMPPAHLKAGIMQCRQPMEEMNKNILKELLSRIQLRVPLDKAKVTRIILQVINFIELQYSLEETGVTKIEVLEKKNRQVLDILLNGIV